MTLGSAARCRNKTMKNLLFLLFIVLSVKSTYSQKNDELVQLSPTIGDNLNLLERNYYGIYPEFEGFKNAVFYIRDNKFLIIKIAYQNNLGENKDTIIVENK